MTKSELREMIRECLREELSSLEAPDIFNELKRLETDDYQQRNGNYPRSGRPDTIYVSDSDIEFSFKNTSQPVAERWVERYLSNEGFKVVPGTINSYQTGDYDDDWVDVSIAISNITTKASLTESSLSAEEKVDAWHAGTRRENYKAAGIPKLQTFLDIAKRKGYTEIVDIIEAEFAKRDIATAPSATVSSGPAMRWEDLIEAADNLLDELCIESDNTFWDDGDGYWSREIGHEWTMRNLYYTNTLNNIDELKKLCDEYSKKLPNVRFYYVEDDTEEDPVSEIGYAAINVDYKGA